VVQSRGAEALFYCRSTRPSAYPGRGGGFVRAFAEDGGKHPHVCLCVVPWLIDAQGEGRVAKGPFVSQALGLEEALTRRARESVFINVPFDKPRIPIYLGLISGIVALGLKPRCVLEIPPTRDRLRRLYQLISGCRYSIHDLSRVQLSGSMRVPRFNMPFELGLSVAVSLRAHEHEWCVFESRSYRLDQSLSDLKGYDPFIYGGTLDGLFTALLDVFAHLRRAPLRRPEDFRYVYDKVRLFARGKLNDDVFRRSSFASLVAAAAAAATQRFTRHRTTSD
jgi:hypothetical protein